jgi:hypothetical protein
MDPIFTRYAPSKPGCLWGEDKEKNHWEAGSPSIAHNTSVWGLVYQDAARRRNVLKQVREQKFDSLRPDHKWTLSTQQLCDAARATII